MNTCRLNNGLKCSKYIKKQTGNREIFQFKIEDRSFLYKNPKFQQFCMTLNFRLTLILIYNHLHG